MSALRVKFGDVVRKVNDKVDPTVDDIDRYVAGDHMDTDEQKILRFGNVGDGYLGPAFHMRFRPGHILYGSRRTYLRKVAMADFEGVCANTTFVIAPSDTRLDASYLLNVMSTERFHQNSISLSKGSTNPYINFSDLATFEFELPSIEDQQRIVELLSGVDAHAEALRNQLNVAQETRKSVLHHLLTAGGDDWADTTLGNVAGVLSGFAFKSELFREDEGLPLIRIRDLYKQSWTEVGYVGEFDTRYIVERGDFLIGMDGEFRCYEWLGSTALLNQRVCRIQDFDVSRVIPRFIFYSINSFLQEIEAQTSFTTVKHLSVKQVKDIVLVLPTLDEQQRIVDEISKIDAVIQETTSSLAATRQLRSALLNKEIS